MCCGGTLILKCFLPVLIATTGRHFNSPYRSRRVMLMSAWPVKNILLLENILASALGANWALWQCSAWLVHINTKEWENSILQLVQRALQGERTQKKASLKDMLAPCLDWWVCKLGLLTARHSVQKLDIMLVKFWQGANNEEDVLEVRVSSGN